MAKSVSGTQPTVPNTSHKATVDHVDSRQRPQGK